MHTHVNMCLLVGSKHYDLHGAAGPTALAGGGGHTPVQVQGREEAGGLQLVAVLHLRSEGEGLGPAAHGGVDRVVGGRFVGGEEGGQGQPGGGGGRRRLAAKWPMFE